MPTAWTYLVVSSGKQRDTLADQRAWAASVAAERGWSIEREYSGVASGKAGPRTILLDLIAELKRAPASLRPTWIIMTRTDRVGRGRIADSQIALHEIRDLGPRVWTRDQGELRLDSAADQLIAAARGATAAFEKEVRVDKSRAMHARKRAAGEVQGLPPYGFIVLEHKLVPYELEAAFIRELFALRRRGWSFGHLSLYARTHGPPKRRKSGALARLRWSHSSIIRMLRNAAYKGTAVPEELFDDVQRRWSRAPVVGKEPKHPWPMRGAVKCVCGLNLTGRVSGSGTYRKRYYVCQDYAAHGGWPGHQAERVERQFLELLRGLREPETLGAYHVEVDVDALRVQRASFERELAATDARRRKAWEMAEDGAVPRDELARRLLDLQAEDERVTVAIEELDRQIDAGRASQELFGDASRSIAQASEIWAEASLPLQREIAVGISALVGGLWLDPARQGELLVGPHGEPRRKAETLFHVKPCAALAALGERIASFCEAI